MSSNLRSRPARAAPPAAEPTRRLESLERQIDALSVEREEKFAAMPRLKTALQSLKGMREGVTDLGEIAHLGIKILEIEGRLKSLQNDYHAGFVKEAKLLQEYYKLGPDLAIYHKAQTMIHEALSLLR